MPVKNIPVQRIAVLDLGTNTFHLLIADVSPDYSCHKVFKSKMVVKLGEGGIHQDFITEQSFERGLRALIHYAAVIKSHKVDHVYAFATAAVRSAKNGPDFAKTILKQTSIKVKIISGEEEAKLICLGVRQAVRLDDKPVLIMDIGGGSTEFIIATGKKILGCHSFNIGAARLLEMFRPSDPIKPLQIKKVEVFLNSQLTELDKFMKDFPVKKLIGSSGSFDTFAEMIGYRFYGRNVLKNVNTYSFNLSEYEKLHEILIRSTTKERYEMKGLIRMRVDMIVLASICTHLVLKKYRLNEMALSKFALKEGALWQISHKLVFPKNMNGLPLKPGAALLRS